MQKFLMLSLALRVLTTRLRSESQGLVEGRRWFLSHDCNSASPIAVRHTLVNLLKPTGYAMHQQFNIQQLYALPTLYLCVLYLSENKQRLVPLTA